MELEKINEAYHLTDETAQGWKTSGQVIKENSGDLKIDLSVTKLDSFLGNYTYNIFVNNHVNVSFGVVREYEQEFRTYCDNLISNILKNINI